MSLWSRICNTLRGERLNREIDEEFHAHLEHAMADGRNSQQARKAFGAPLNVREQVRDIRLIPWLDSLRSDTVFGCRQLAKNRITSLAAILSLALAIGACTSAFRLIDAILLRPLPVAHANDVFQLMRDAAKGQATLIAISYDGRTDLTYKSDQDMEKAHVQYVSGNMFSAFGLQPALGRLLTPDDDTTPGAHPVAVISYDYWTRRFSNDPDVAGKAFRIDNNIFQIVGVAQSSFTGTEPGAMTEIFIPTMMHPAVIRDDSAWHRVFAIVQPGVPIEPLRAKLASISLAFETERSKSWLGQSPEEIARVLDQTLYLRSASSGASGFQQDNRRALLALAALVFLVLLIACANVAPHARRRLMYALIAAQVAFCCLVLFVAGLFVSTFQRLARQPLGFSSDRLVLDTVTNDPVAPAGWLQLADQLRFVPGVERVSVSNRALLANWSNSNSVSVNGGVPSSTPAYFLNVSPGWLDTMKILLLDGRDFLPTDTTPGAAIVNQSFATMFFKDENPLGRFFEEIFPDGVRARFQVIGIVRDAHYRSIREEHALPTAYLPFLSPDPRAWWSASGATFIVRAGADNPLALASTLRQAISQARAEFRVSNIRTQQEIIQAQSVRERFLATLASFFSAVALLLAAVGLYGVLYYSVQQRRREIAIRMAIGAQAPNIVKLVTVPLFVTVAAGALTGLIAGQFAARYLNEIFYQVTPTDAPMLALPAVSIVAAGFIAALPAALRALHTYPASILRSE